MAALGVFLFVVMLLASIAIHELGHLLTAKKFGMKASRYFIGMGPTLWSTHRGETEYGVKALPIGGFVKIVGMTQLEEVEDPKDEPRAFWRQPAKQRAVVLAAGSFMHFVIAFVLLFGALMFYGEETSETTRIAEVSQCLDADPVTKSCEGKPLAPAKVAGLREGDRVVEVEGKPVTTWDEFTTIVRARPAGPVTLVVERGDERLTLRPNVERHVRKIDEGEPKEVGQIGLLSGEQKRYNPITAVGRSGAVMWELTYNSVKGLVKLPLQIPKMFRETAKAPGTAERGATGESVVGIVDVGRLAGRALEAGRLDALLGLVAGLNVFIGLFNLVPLLPLDGGHLGILGFESLRSRIARMRGRPDPGRVDLNKLMPAMVAFIVVMGSLTVMLLYAGFANPVSDQF